MIVDENSSAAMTMGVASLSGQTNDFVIKDGCKVEDNKKDKNINKSKIIFNKINNAQLLNNILLKDINNKEE